MEKWDKVFHNATRGGYIRSMVGECRMANPDRCQMDNQGCERGEERLMVSISGTFHLDGSALALRPCAKALTRRRRRR